jgi:hypothetical protein
MKESFKNEIKKFTGDLKQSMLESLRITFYVTSFLLVLAFILWLLPAAWQNEFRLAAKSASAYLGNPETKQKIDAFFYVTFKFLLLSCFGLLTFELLFTTLLSMTMGIIRKLRQPKWGAKGRILIGSELVVCGLAAYFLASANVVVSVVDKLARLFIY